MTLRELSKEIKKRYGNQKECFFTEKALLSAVFEKNGFSRNALLLSPEAPVEERVCRRVLEDADRLLSGEPIQYYLGSEFFCGLEFTVRPGVLIPRPETERLVELACEAAPKDGLVFDLCCGSGCVGLSLLSKRPDLRCMAFDLSPEAVKLSEENSARLGFSSRYSVFQRDVLATDFLPFLKEMKPSVILANPPYLTQKEMTEIPANVKNEPSLALYGGEDGLDFYRAFSRYARETGIALLCEMGFAQENRIRKILENDGLSPKFYQDFSKLPRGFCVCGKK